MYLATEESADVAGQTWSVGRKINSWGFGVGDDGNRRVSYEFADGSPGVKLSPEQRVLWLTFL
jgi:hypothetical protein